MSDWNSTIVLSFSGISGEAMSGAEPGNGAERGGVISSKCVENVIAKDLDGLEQQQEHLYFIVDRQINGSITKNNALNGEEKPLNAIQSVAASKSAASGIEPFHKSSEESKQWNDNQIRCAYQTELQRRKLEQLRCEEQAALYASDADSDDDDEDNKRQYRSMQGMYQPAGAVIIKYPDIPDPNDNLHAWTNDVWKCYAQTAGVTPSISAQTLEYAGKLISNIISDMNRASIWPKDISRSAEANLKMAVQEEEFVKLFRRTVWKNVISSTRAKRLFAILQYLAGKTVPVTFMSVLQAMLWLGYPDSPCPTMKLPAQHAIDLPYFMYCDPEYHTQNEQSAAGAAFVPFMSRAEAEMALDAYKVIVRFSSVFGSDDDQPIIHRGIIQTHYHGFICHRPLFEIEPSGSITTLFMSNKGYRRRGAQKHTFFDAKPLLKAYTGIQSRYLTSEMQGLSTLLLDNKIYLHAN